MIEIVQFSAVDQTKFENVAPRVFYCWETGEIVVQQGELALFIEGNGGIEQAMAELLGR